jgi:hypothetical protein
MAKLHSTKRVDLSCAVTLAGRNAKSLTMPILYLTSSLFAHSFHMSTCQIIVTGRRRSGGPRYASGPREERKNDTASSNPWRIFRASQKAPKRTRALVSGRTGDNPRLWRMHYRWMQQYLPRKPGAPPSGIRPCATRPRLPDVLFWDSKNVCKFVRWDGIQKLPGSHITFVSNNAYENTQSLGECFERNARDVRT